MVGGGTTFLQAKTANEVLKAAELSASCSDATGQQITVEQAAMQKVLSSHVRAHLDELAGVRPNFR